MKRRYQFSEQHGAKGSLLLINVGFRPDCDIFTTIELRIFGGIYTVFQPPLLYKFCTMHIQADVLLFSATNQLELNVHNDRLCAMLLKYYNSNK